MILLLACVLAGLLLVMAWGWTFQRAMDNGGWTDVFWTFGAGLACLTCALYPADGDWARPTSRQVAAALLVGVWTVRLGVHITLRVAGSGEDARYAELRQDWGRAFQRRMLGFLLAQAPAGAVLAGALYLAAHNPAPLGGALDFSALVLAVLSLAGEGLADAQLRRFKADPANKGGIASSGLWAWSRHPNYFFEWLFWLAVPALAIDPEGGYRQGWLAFAAPALMFLLLNFVSGVPPLERSMRRSRGQAFADYCARTSRFFPLPPRADPPTPDEPDRSRPPRGREPRPAEGRGGVGLDEQRMAHAQRL